MSDNLMSATITMRNVDTLSIQQKEARKAFDSAQSVDQMRKAFREMEDCFDQSDLGLQCLTLARKLIVTNCDRKEVIRFGKRALKILNANISNDIPCFGKTSSSGVVTDGKRTCRVYHKSPLYVSCALHVLGAACVDLKSYDDAFSYLDRASNHLSELEMDCDSCCVGDCVLRAVDGTQFQLYRVKVFRNDFGGAVFHMKKVLEVNEKMLEEDCIEIGEVYKNVGLTYYGALDFEEALGYMLKAVDIYLKHLRGNSVEVAEMRRNIGNIYRELGECGKADEQRKLSESVLKNVPLDPNCPYSLIEAGRNEEAIAVLNGVVSRDDMAADSRASAFVSMAKAFYNLGKFGVAKKHLRTARRLLEKKDLNQKYVALMFVQISSMYEKMNDSETAISLSRRVLASPKLPQNIRSESSMRLYNLIFLSAKHVDEMIKALKDIEGFCEDPVLGLGCWKIAGELLSQGRSPEDVISFGNRALKIFIAIDISNNPYFAKTFSRASINTGTTGALCSHNHKMSFYIALVCNLLASASLRLTRYNECLSYLSWAYRNLSKLQEGDDSSCGSNCILQALLTNQKEMCGVKVEMGRFEEAILHFRKTVDIQEEVMEEGCIELCTAYEDVSGGYFVLMNFEEALAFHLKALEIRTKHCGRNSVEVAKKTKHLAVIYIELGEYEKALEQNQLSLDILKSMAPLSPELLEAEICHGKILTGMGQYEEAIKVLKSVVSLTDTEGETQASAFVTMATAFCYLENFADAKKYMTTAQRILENNKVSSISVAIGFRDMSRLYEKMNDFEKTISLLRRVLAIPDIPRKLLAQCSTRLFSLISLHCKVKKGIPYMEDVVEKLKDSFGPEHREVGYGYRNLGAAYVKSGQKDLALKFMVKAKDILDASLGSHHLDSLKASQILAETYVTTGRRDQAIKIQEKVIEGLKGMVPSEQNFLYEAVTCLNKMKETES